MEDKPRSLQLPHAELTNTIIGAFYDVANELGHGFSEHVLCRAMAIALKERGLAVRSEADLPVHFHGQLIGVFQADLVVEETVVLEVKVSAEVQSYAEVQLINYLKAAGGRLGLLLNFGRRAEVRRRVVGDPVNSLPLLRAAASWLPDDTTSP
jgi:GxxExxY protein